MGLNEAWISARAGCAIVVTDTDHFLLEAGREAPPKPCAPGRLNNLRALASDAVQIDAGPFPFPEVKAILETAWEEQSALDFTLMALDRKLSGSLRENAARVASQLMETETVRLAVRRRLLGVPLPEEADLEGAPREGVVAELVQEAADNRDLVAIVDQAWDRVFGEHYSYRELRRLKEAAIALGGFAALVDVLRLGDRDPFNRWLKRKVDPLGNRVIQGLLSKWRATASRLYEPARGDPPYPPSVRFEDFILQLDAGSHGEFCARVLKSPEGEGSIEFSIPWLAGGEPASYEEIGSRNIVLQGSRPPLEIGKELFRSVFQGQVRTLLHRSLARLNSQDVGLRLKIKLNPRDKATSYLADLPWEMLYDENSEGFFTLSRQTSLVRFLEVRRPSRPIPLSTPLRILAAAASPRGLQPLDLDAEARGIKDLNRSSSGVEVEFLLHASTDAVREALAGDTYHVLHFMGHGTFDRASGEGMLVFESSDGSPDPVSGKDLANNLKSLRNLGVVVVNACKTPHACHEEVANPLLEVATASVLGGIPAVVAMQYPISDRAAVAFSTAFYRHLARCDSIDEALTEGRQAIHTVRPQSFEWATPALFLRIPEGNVFVAANLFFKLLKVFRRCL